MLAWACRRRRCLSYRLRTALPGLSRATIFVDFPHGTGTDGMADAAGQGRRGAQPLGFSAGAHRRPRPRPAGRRIPLRPRRHRRGSASTASRAATSSITSWSCPKARTCSTSRAAVEQLGPLSRRRNSWKPPATRADPRSRPRGRPRSKATCSRDTYRLSRHTTPERLCRIMTGKFREVWRSLRTTTPACTALSPWPRWSKRKANWPRSGRASPRSSQTACASA